MPSSARFGESVALGALPAGVPIGALVGDSHAALFGHAGFGAARVKATYGTGSSLMMPTQRRLEARGWCRRHRGLGPRVDRLRPRGQHLRDRRRRAVGRRLRGAARRRARWPSWRRAARATDGVYLVPAFTGLGAPHWDDTARGLVSGLTRGSTLAQLARAAVEAIAYQVRDVFDVMQAASGGALRVLLADGGVTRNAQLMQFQADILGVPVQRNDTPELSAMGAAYLAGLAAGVWASTDEIEALPRSVVRFEPAMAAAERERLYRRLAGGPGRCAAAARGPLGSGSVRDRRRRHGTSHHLDL